MSLKYQETSNSRTTSASMTKLSIFICHEYRDWTAEWLSQSMHI